MPVHVRIARNVKAFAAFQGRSIESIYDEMGMSKQVWSTRMKGKPNLDSDELERLAAIFDVSTDTLLSDPSMLVERMRAWVTAEPDEHVQRAA